MSITVERFLTSYKTEECKHTNDRDHDRQFCFNWHTEKEIRRNPYTFEYSPTRECRKPKCDFERCKYFHSSFERYYHPIMYGKGQLCDGAKCRNLTGNEWWYGFVCTYRHKSLDDADGKESPEDGRKNPLDAWRIENVRSSLENEAKDDKKLMLYHLCFVRDRLSNSVLVSLAKKLSSAEEEWAPLSLAEYCGYTLFKLLEEYNEECALRGVEFGCNAAGKKVVFSPNKKRAVINVNLATESMEFIYLHFSLKDGFPMPSLESWSSEVGLRGFEGILPEPARYFSSVSDLMMDPNIKVVADLDHLIDRYQSRSRNFERKGVNKEEFNSLVREEFRKAQDRLKLNFNHAVPAYYRPKRHLPGVFCFLIPLQVRGELLVFAIQQEKSEKEAGKVVMYSARTILTKKMAYSIARLLVKPSASWIVDAAIPMKGNFIEDDLRFEPDDRDCASGYAAGAILSLEKHLASNCIDWSEMRLIKEQGRVVAWAKKDGAEEVHKDEEDSGEELGGDEESVRSAW
eukprot:TRINITY_DN628_c0_g1_i1.p1 TRINITY_DN628_c0_g1~~TRINITY_DN628_c0_g1_i1.p1  ORF type:complete len:537 (+),score=134.49 TRINITY_DN628_c0_g1_i1:67-1611(+)